MRRSAGGSSAATRREDTEQGVRRAHKETVEKLKQPDREKNRGEEDRGRVRERHEAKSERKLYQIWRKDKWCESV